MNRNGSFLRGLSLMRHLRTFLSIAWKVYVGLLWMAGIQAISLIDIVTFPITNCQSLQE